jgi:hypothetical protein
MSRIIEAAALHFALVFGAGFVLGVVRVVLVVPRLGERWAELAEAPFMCATILLAARFIVRTRLAGAGVSTRLAAGLLALILMLATEFAVVLWVRDLPPSQWFAGRDPIAGLVYAALLILFAIAPALQHQR